MTEPASKAIETLIARLADRTARVGMSYSRDFQVR
jgi:hypothetical protein